MNSSSPTPLQLPLTPYTIGGYGFRQRLRRHIILWATHLGDDVVAPPGTTVVAISYGKVVFAEIRPGTAQRRNWGGLVVIEHSDPRDNSTFYSVYGHLNNLHVRVGQRVTPTQPLGNIAASTTPENGWWKIPHLHFAIYSGPWHGQTLPGYKRPEQRRTRLKYWHDPQQFIEEYNRYCS